MPQARWISFLKLFGCLCLLTLSAIFWAAGCGEEKTAAPSVPKVVVSEVRQIKVPLQKVFNGNLTAKEAVEVRARVSGYVAERTFEEGSQVKAGQVLYKLDDRDLAAALDTAKANTAKARAARESADTTRRRMVDLADKGAVSLQQRDTAVAKADEALAAYQAAQAEEEKAEVNLSYATIFSPTSGYISRSNVEVGSNVDAGSATLMTTVYNFDPIRAEFSVTDKEYVRFKKDIADRGDDPRTVAFTILLGDDRVTYDHPGVLEMADPIIDSKTNTLGVRVEFPNPDHILRPGMYVNVVGTGGEIEALVVPEVALVDQAAGKYVFTVDEKNTLVSVPVTVGEKMGDDRVILIGLSAGQKVVVEGLVTARPGLVVEPVTKDAPPADQAEAAAN